MRSSAADATAWLCASTVTACGESESLSVKFAVFRLREGDFADAGFAFVSFPTTSRSRGDASINNALRFSAGNDDIDCRIKSRRHVSESDSAKILMMMSESAGVHGRKL